MKLALIACAALLCVSEVTIGADPADARRADGEKKPLAGKVVDPRDPRDDGVIGPVDDTRIPLWQQAMEHNEQRISSSAWLEFLRTHDVNSAFFIAPATQPSEWRSFEIPPATRPATQPATQPVDAKLKALINQLGDDSPRLRDEAATALRKLGKDALPALRGASNDDDPQIRTSAQALITEITEKDKPRITDSIPDGGVILFRNGGIVMHNVRIQNGIANGQVQVQMRVANGQSTRDITVNENGRKVVIHEDNDGLKMQVTDNGETKEYKAKNADELKEKEPEAYKTYEKYAKNAGGHIRIEVAPPIEVVPK